MQLAHWGTFGNRLPLTLVHPPLIIFVRHSQLDFRSGNVCYVNRLVLCIGLFSFVKLEVSPSYFSLARSMFTNTKTCCYSSPSVTSSVSNFLCFQINQASSAVDKRKLNQKHVAVYFVRIFELCVIRERYDYDVEKLAMTLICKVWSGRGVAVGRTMNFYDSKMRICPELQWIRSSISFPSSPPSPPTFFPQPPHASSPAQGPKRVNHFWQKCLIKVCWLKLRPQTCLGQLRDDPARRTKCKSDVLQVL